MENKEVAMMKIKKTAMSLIARIVISCHEGGLLPVEAVLIEKAKAGEILSRADFEKAGKVRMYADMEKLAQKMSKKEIDEEVVIAYFGGFAHEKKVLEDIQKEGLEGGLADFYLFRHLLLPVEIIGRKNGHLTVEYWNGQAKVTIEDALVFNGDKELGKAGSWALFHYASVVVIDPDKEIVRKLLNEQQNCPTFMESAAHFNGKAINMKKLAGSIAKLMAHHEA